MPGVRLGAITLELGGNQVIEVISLSYTDVVVVFLWLVTAEAAPYIVRLQRTKVALVTKHFNDLKTTRTTQKQQQNKQERLKKLVERQVLLAMYCTFPTDKCKLLYPEKSVLFLFFPRWTTTQRGLWGQNYARAKYRRLALEKGKEESCPQQQRVRTFIFVLTLILHS